MRKPKMSLGGTVTGTTESPPIRAISHKYSSHKSPKMLMITLYTEQKKKDTDL